MTQENDIVVQRIKKNTLTEILWGNEKVENDMSSEYISQTSSLLRNKECPTCRKKLVSRRSLRRDSNFDALISKIYPSRDEYEAHQRRVLDRLNRLHNKEALSSSIEEGLRQQARYRSERWGTKRGDDWGSTAD